MLRCGNLTSDVQVLPRPDPVIIDEEVDPMPRTVQTGMSKEASEMIMSLMLIDRWRHLEVLLAD